jgi:E3 ubiquitin-protein ligase BOI-like protein
MAPPPPVKEEYINLFALQQPAPFYNMAQLQSGRVASSPSPAPGSRVSTGLRLALDEQQQRQMNSLCYAASSSPSPLGSFSDEFAGQVKQHGEELDRFIGDQVIHLGSARNSPYRCWLFRACSLA